jgi:hypothetical protein
MHPTFAATRRLRVLVAAFGLAMLAAAPAQAKPGIANPYDCTPEPTLTQPFAPFGDSGLYTPVTDAGVEAGATSWALEGGATVVAGNEPWQIGGATDSNSLDLPAGSTAVTAPICIDQTYPYFRTFALNAGSATRSLEIDVLYYNAKGKLLSTKPYGYESDSTTWQPTPTIAIEVFDDDTTVAAAPVAFRFMPKGKDAHFRIDDVYVDPYSRSR